jgi:hypothetical protein
MELLLEPASRLLFAERNSDLLATSSVPTDDAHESRPDADWMQ